MIQEMRKQDEEEQEDETEEANLVQDVPQRRHYQKNKSKQVPDVASENG